MKKALFRLLAALMKGLGVILVFSGLTLAADRQFIWGLFVFAAGLTILGLQEEGWL